MFIFYEIQERLSPRAYILHFDIITGLFINRIYKRFPSLIPPRSIILIIIIGKE
jgi:hypothetical protein